MYMYICWQLLSNQILRPISRSWSGRGGHGVARVS